jgi:transcriptional regulator with XRE-family HTH domain/quercetin dioxygenase-like cupin family protein
VEAAAQDGWEPIVGAIGPKLRAARQALGLSLQQLAARSGVSAAAIHKVERGDMVPTVTTLLKLAAAVGLPIGHFVEDGGPAAPIATHIPAGTRRPAPADWASAAQGVAAHAIAGPTARLRAGGVCADIAPGGGSGAGPAARPGEQLLLVLEGALQVEIGGESHRVEAGGTLHYPTDHAVQWHNPGSTAARAVWFTVPG